MLKKKSHFPSEMKKHVSQILLSTQKEKRFKKKAEMFLSKKDKPFLEKKRKILMEILITHLRQQLCKCMYLQLIRIITLAFETSGFLRGKLAKGLMELCLVIKVFFSFKTKAFHCHSEGQRDNALISEVRQFPRCQQGCRRCFIYL